MKLSRQQQIKKLKKDEASLIRKLQQGEKNKPINPNPISPSVEYLAWDGRQRKLVKQLLKLRLKLKKLKPK